MPITYPDRRVLPVAQILMDCLAQEALLNPKPPQIVGFRTGTEGEPLGATVDDECCRGAAFVRVVRTFASTDFPTPATLAVSCAQPMAAEFELSMWRCAPIGTMSGLVSQSGWDEVNTDLLNDRATMMGAACCFMGRRDQRSVMYGDWQAVSVDGGCVGSKMTIQAALYGRGV